MDIKISALKDETPVCFEDIGGITDWDWCFCDVKTLKDYIQSDPESVGKAFFAVKVRYELNKNSLKDYLEELFDQEVVPAENFIYHEAFVVDELWDKETLGKVKKLLDDMLSNSGYFQKKTDTEIDYSELVPQKESEESK